MIACETVVDQIIFMEIIRNADLLTNSIVLINF